jgi:hypothetical protein
VGPRPWKGGHLGASRGPFAGENALPFAMHSPSTAVLSTLSYLCVCSSVINDLAEDSPVLLQCKDLAHAMVSPQWYHVTILLREYKAKALCQFGISLAHRLRHAFAPTLIRP